MSIYDRSKGMHNLKSDERYKKIDKISPSFCLAKWLQVTIDLKHGTNHSCHHPERHIIPKHLLENDPSVLHNTPFKKRQRKSMLEGVRPPECSYCWEVEDSPGENVSDRYIKSTDPWAYPSLDRIANLPWDSNVSPTYIELMFDSKCNLSCSYCMADISTSIMKEMDQYGPYPVTDKQHRMPKHSHRVDDDIENDYQKAFWKWLPTLKDELQVLRITGGEPFLSSQNDKLLDYLKTEKFTKLKLIVNSNLSLPKELVEKKLNKIIDLKKMGHILDFELYTSLDSYGDQAAYIRSGLNHDLFWKNIDLVFSLMPKIELVIMCTYNILSISKFDQLIEKVKAYKEKGQNLVLDLSYLKNPFYLRANLADEELKEKMQKSYSLIKSLVALGIFSHHELKKFENTYNWVMDKENQVDLVRGRRDFYSFINEYDKRKKNSFLSVFPEYEKFYKMCQKVFLFSEADIKAQNK